MLHGSRLDVDESVRVSSLTTELRMLRAEVNELRALLGVTSPQKPLVGLLIGPWRLRADEDDLVKEVDENLNSGVRSWTEKERDSI